MPDKASDLSISTLADHYKLLSKIQDRVLWLTMQMIYYANSVRSNSDGSKVGGHQASSASIVTILTALFFDYMNPGDRIAIKPHASPAFHAIQYLLDNLDRKYLKTLREYQGLQAYPSRTKDPDFVDFSTGSVGLGAIAPNFAALAEQYVHSHFSSSNDRPNRFISVIGDGELDEGSIWEAIVEPHTGGLDNLLWIVDLNRQSLDRVVPGIRVQLWREMFSANGWNVIDAKYGKRLEKVFTEPNGHLLRECIDEMPNQFYQRLLRLSPEELREWLPRRSRYPEDLRDFTGQWDDVELMSIFQDLGGHDFEKLSESFSKADAVHQPSVLFAYTLKGWRLPVIGDPHNHSVILNEEDMGKLRVQCGVPKDDVWSKFSPESKVGHFCMETGKRLRPRSKNNRNKPSLIIPSALSRIYQGNISTQQAFGLMLTDISRELPSVDKRVVTVSPDVASSTNLGARINKVGVWSHTEVDPLPQEKDTRLLRWEESPKGQHVELGISESNLFMLLGQLGLSFERSGELLFPIGTLYDPFICRAVEAFIYGIYSDARFIVVGTPSGITLSREGGAHQSSVTPSIGTELPGVVFYEPCFAQELEWILLASLNQILWRKESTYLRLSTKVIDQELFDIPDDPVFKERIRYQVLKGAYRLIDLRGQVGYEPSENVVHIFTSGAMVPESIEASKMLKVEGVFANVVNVTSPDRLFREFQKSVLAGMTAESDSTDFLTDVIPSEDRASPVVTVIDGHPHGLAWIGGALGTKSYPLGVSEFGQSGTRQDLYHEYQIDVQAIMAACFNALEVDV